MPMGKWNSTPQYLRSQPRLIWEHDQSPPLTLGEHLQSHPRLQDKHGQPPREAELRQDVQEASLHVSASWRRQYGGRRSEWQDYF